MQKDPETKRYEEYFKSDLDDIQKTIGDIDAYKKTIDGRIGIMTSAGSRGGEHYLTEHIKNAIALQTMKETLLQDRFSIHKSIMDYAVKAAASDSDDNEATLIAIERQLYNRQLADIKSAQKIIGEQKPDGSEAANTVTADAEIDAMLKANPVEKK
jgi:hypothetical protein